jgi:hypothetical protein
MTTDGGRAGATEAREPDKATIAAARELLQHAELVNIMPISISASVRDGLRDRAADNARVRVEPSYSAGQGMMANRFRYLIELLDGADELVAELDFTVQVDYDVDPEYTPADDAADFVAATTGSFAAYPYARELAQDLTTRLQLDPLVIGLLPRGADRPDRVTQVARSGR